MSGNRPESVPRWATPTARDHFDAALRSPLPRRKDGKPRGDTTPQQVLMEESYKGKLNPRWVETLMGLPIGWVMPTSSTLVITEQMSSEHLEMGLCQIQQREHLECSGIDLWMTPKSVQRGENVKTYLRHCKKLRGRGVQIFTPMLQTQVEAAELGIDLDEA